MIYSVSPELYCETVARLKEAAGPAGYFSGSLAFRFDGVECRLVASLLVYRSRVSLPEGEADAVSDFVPVWWEFHTVGVGGEMPNDFSFGELRRYV